ncbi:hypothetical protein SAICODRAFT_187480 [Saitoella complicata NRRL Y-17804]|uniref:uncharacterized protein n=1 Tax=Saitoella complicata (strain BCRC 22490 / CBS 7301 / JCM 7358 / NBRC 10748 / NRRL Y-17804) TaxID=698492 RepID=UPI0008680530|nr:uncharacterized protein SAICODRAFT_187480 [Saitoella complicata NRRL Y-17804]ODQ49850.1 hypothetical protein SAICODRAFT_187480 [Saitoella complicata NRRL Y-17804]
MGSRWVHARYTRNSLALFGIVFVLAVGFLESCLAFVHVVLVILFVLLGFDATAVGNVLFCLQLLFCFCFPCKWQRIYLIITNQHLFSLFSRCFGFSHGVSHRHADSARTQKGHRPR